jgi:hypothetical protein
MTARSLFETLALSQITDNLGERSDGGTCDVDRVTALGFSPRLGSLLIRLKGANDPKCHADALEMIAGRLLVVGRRKNWGPLGRMRRVAQAALQHYLVDMCPACSGRGVIPKNYAGPQDDDAGDVCMTCHGTGKAERNLNKRAMAILQPGELPRNLEKMLDHADGMLERAQRMATGISRSKLYGNWH